MTRVRKAGLGLLALLLAVCLGFALAGCGNKETEPTYGYGEEGTYYYSVSDDTDYLLTLGGGSFILETGSTGYAGTYECVDGTVTFYEEGEETGSGYATEGGFSLTWEGKTYAFLRYEYYTVSFTDGGTTLSTQSVLNGKAASDPGDAEKEGYVFLGWYADSAFTTRYEFNTSVTSDTTIYARFVEASSGAAEYVITYDYTGETTETINGVVYNLPEPEQAGYTFLGWWVSATNNASELTYKYDGETLCEDTTLFAFWAQGSSYMGASVYDDGITWENYSASVTEIILRAEDGSEMDRFSIQSTSGSYSYDFASLPAGKYTLIIQGGGIDETLTYVSNGLSRVSGFTVISGSILMYSPVENAERYYITIECGNPSHDHTYVDNGTSLYYDFSSCEMPAEGITFTVYAYAEGYYPSVSSGYNYFLGLDKAAVTVEGNTATWGAVPYAQEYEVYIDGTLVATTSGTSWSLSGYGTGTYEISVRPVTTGYYSELSETYVFTKTTLAAPKVTGIENYVVSWTEVEGATGYKISIGGVETTVEEGITSLYLTEDNYIEGLDSYEISVKAMAEDSANDSPYGEAITVTGNSVGSTVSYNDGTVTWQYSLSASEYRITVNDGDETVVFGRNSSPVTLTRSGNNEIAIYFVDSDDNVFGTASVNVYAYAIVFDARGGTAYMDGEVVDTIYAAKGDTVTLPEADYGAATADFAGWYTLPDMTDDPDAVDYMGDGVKYGDEGGAFVFTGNSTIVLYACWLNPRMIVSLDPGMGTLTDGNGNAITDTAISLNGRNYTVAVPETGDAQYVFYGWYSGANGTGTRYTDEEGNAYAPFSDESVTTLYAYWIQVLEITSASYNTSGADNVFSVSKGPDISLVSEVTIPESYTVGGVEYTEGVISSSTAFSGCTKLKTINIPDTVIYINIVNNGYDSGAGAFNGTALENVNIYATGEPSTTREIIYYSNDGVLFWINAAGDVELLYYPYGRTDETYTVPETVINENELELSGNREVQAVHYVNALGGSAFRGHEEITYMVIPEYITVVGTYLFYNCTSLTGVEFAGEVEKLEDYMFYGCSSLTEFDIPYTVKELGDSVFRSCTGFTTFTIPEHVETIGTYTFYGCTNLRTVYLPSTLKKVNDYTFYNCQALTGIEIPYGVEELGDYVFYQCYGLTTVTIPDSVTTLGSYTFRNCSNLETVTMSQNLTSMGTYTFFYCTSLRSITLPEGLTAIGNYDFENCSQLSEVNLPDSLETIGNGAFEYCMALTSIVIPKNVININSQAFYGCYKLVEVYNLSSLNITTKSSSNGYVGYYAKAIHTSLDEPSSVIHEGGFLFIEDRYGYSLIGYEGTDPNPVIPDEYIDDIYEVSSYAFYGNTVIESLTLPDCIEEIGEYAFEECTSLKTVTLPANIYEIPWECFGYCTSLIYITIPDGVRYIDDEAFWYCTSLVGVTIGRNVTNISDYAFDECTRIAEVVNLSSLNIVAGSSDNGYVAYYAKSVVTSEADSHLEYEDGFLSVYDRDDNYFLLGYYGTDTDLVLPDYIDGHTYEISEYAFDGMSSLTSLKIGKGATKIGDYAFRNCSNVAGALVIPDSVKEIGAYAFYKCSAVETLTLGSSLESIGNYAFYGLELIESVDLPENLRDIGNYAFYGCEKLAKITFPDGLGSIGRAAFEDTAFFDDPSNWDGSMFYIKTFLMGVDTSYSGALVVRDGTTLIAGNACNGATGITSVTLPDTVQSIGDYAFYGCTALTSINIPSSVYYIGDDAFYNCSNLSLDLNLKGNELTIGSSAFRGSGITSITACFEYISIGSNAFYNVTSLKSADFGGTQVLDIGNSAFYGCSGMTYLDISGARGTLGTYAFRECTSLETVTVPGTVTKIDTYAFYGCTGLKTLIIEEGVQELANYILNKSENIETVYIPSTIESMDIYVFDSLNNLKNVYLADGLTVLGQSMFYKCNGLESITIPSSITTMGSNVFYNCTGLKEVTLSDGLTFIGSSMFYNCTGLESIAIPTSIETINSSAFNGCSNLKYVYITDLGAWAGIDFGNANANPLNLGASLYLDGELVTDLVLPEGTEKIGTYAFYGFESAKTIVIPSTVTSIGNYAFYNTYGVEEIYFNATECADVTSASNYIFYNTGKNAASVTLTIGANVTKIPNYMFSPYNNASYAPNITSIVFAEGSVCESIGTYAFRYISGITSIELPATVKTIGTYAFYNCTGLESIILPDAVTEIATYTFYGCSSLEWIVIGANVTSIGSNAFYNCSKLSAVYFMGDETAWNKVSVGSSNSPLTSATVYYYSASEPTTDGNFWYYVDGVPTVWKKD